jgi:hypothetical protein
MFFVGTFFPFLMSNLSLKVSVGRLTNIRTKLNAVQAGSPDVHFISELERIFGNPSIYQSKDGIKYCLQQICHMERGKAVDYQRIQAKSMAISLLPSLIRIRLHQSPDTSNFVFEQLIALLQHPSIDDHLLLPLLHMLKVFLATTSFPPISLLSRITAAVTPYYIWPRPYSDAAREVIEVAACETRSPGTALRTTLMEENPALVPGLPGAAASTPSDASHIPKERNAWLLLDKDLIRARCLNETLKQHIPTQTSTVELQMRFLATIFSTALKMKPEALGLEYATSEQIGLFYGAAITVLEHSLSLPEGQAIAYYTAELASLQKKIMGEIGSVAHQKPARPSRLPPLNIVPKLVPFSVKEMVVDVGAHTRHHFPKRESFEHLHEILRQAMDLVVLGEKPPIVKIGIVGSDDTIHNLATGWLVLSSVHADIIEKLDVRFFFVPVDNSDLGNWIASLDPWYGRQAIVLPRAIQGLYPSADSNSSGALVASSSASSLAFGSSNNASSSSGGSASASSPLMSGANSGRSMSMRLDASLLSQGLVDLIDEHSKLISPSSILHSELEHLFREARYPLNLNIFRAECVLPDNSTLTLPFFSRACVGLSAAIEAFKKINDLGASLTEAEITAHKNFKWNPPTLAMKYIQMNPMSVARAIGQQDPRVYTTVTLAAIPIAGDKANFSNPDPTNPWLELSLVEDKKKRTGARDEVRTYHVSQLELSGPEPFDLCLDGIYYGSVARVKFTAATHAEKDAVYKLPLMTFFPTDGLH